MMNYIGIDGNIRSDELKHWKYIKKIKSGKGWRYFYTPEEVRAYERDKIEKDRIDRDIIERDKIEKDRIDRDKIERDKKRT